LSANLIPFLASSSGATPRRKKKFSATISRGNSTFPPQGVGESKKHLAPEAEKFIFSIVVYRIQLLYFSLKNNQPILLPAKTLLTVSRPNFEIQQ
jgi:hypothetical protein